MANRRELVKRREAVRNIRKITRTMQLIATARFQAALKRATQGKPYAEKLRELANDLAAAAGEMEHPLMRRPETTERSIVLILTSTRGLCGAYNANVLRRATEHLDEAQSAGVETEAWIAGKKGANYFRFVNRPITETVSGVGEKPSFEEVQPIADSLMSHFLAGETDAVDVAYMKVHSPGKQEAVVERLLPLTPAATAEGEEKQKRTEYEFLPSAAELLEELLPATVRVRLFQAVMDATVSEQVARMVAMKAATDAAEDMNKRLTRAYNRARQTAITMELLDIVGGANALE